jgi:hypothetical protein
MSTNVHIERLFLDSLPTTSGQGDLIQAAVETELTRLLMENGLSLSSVGAVHHLSAASIQLTHDCRPSSLGHQIAQAIYGSLTPAAAGSRGGTHFFRGQRE